MRSTVRSWLLIFFGGHGPFIVLNLTILELVVGDGLDRLSENERAAAQEVLNELNTSCLDNPITRVLTRQIRVVEVVFVPGCTASPAGVRLEGVGMSPAYHLDQGSAHTTFSPPLARATGLLSKHAPCSAFHW